MPLEAEILRNVTENITLTQKIFWNIFTNRGLYFRVSLYEALLLYDTAGDGLFRLNPPLTSEKSVIRRCTNNVLHFFKKFQYDSDIFTDSYRKF